LELRALREEQRGILEVNGIFDKDLEMAKFGT